MLKVAVIGAGAAGLVTARELTRAGHEVTVFEQGNEVGGTWIYRPESEPDPLGQTGSRIHSSMYASMRTNLPRDVMAFSITPLIHQGVEKTTGRVIPATKRYCNTWNGSRVHFRSTN